MAILLPCGRETDSKELYYSKKYNRTFIALKNGDCDLAATCSTCRACINIYDRCADYHGHSYCSRSKKTG